MNQAPAPIVPPFTESDALRKVRAAEDAWNRRDPDKTVLAYTEDTVWRNRSTHLEGREAVRAFLRDKWSTERDYRLVKELWAFGPDKIAVRFQYEFHDDAGQWWRAYGNENWQFAADGRMARREASINDVAIAESDRRLLWPNDDGRVRPAEHAGLIDSPA